MIPKMFKSNESLDHNLPKGGSSPSLLRPGELLVFISGHARRGGLRLLLQLCAGLCFIFLLLHIAPSRIVDGYGNIMSWYGSKQEDAGNLRIVVFGSQDVAGSAVQGDNQRGTWTQHLCVQLNCSSFHSFVPHSDSAPGLTSNELYATELQKLQEIADATDLSEKPATDYHFMTEQYPVPVGTPDLAGQVSQFLAMTPPSKAPRHTIWVFSFGTWDIWNLAAMPKPTAEGLVDRLADNIFEQIELLYRMSLDRESIAYSDFFSNVSDSNIAELTAPDAVEKIDHRRLESFRVVIPKLFDITLTPGWHNRPYPSIPHSSAEQMRDAAALTKRWNDKMLSKLKEWMKQGTSKPVEPEHSIQALAVDAQAPAQKRDVAGEEKPAEAIVPPTPAEHPVYAPYPMRLGIQSNPASIILDAMTEEEMQRSGLRDSKGRGTLGAEGAARFFDVWTPCIGRGSSELEAEGSSECEEPNDHLFYDAFTIGQRALEEVAQITAQVVQNDLLPPLVDGHSWWTKKR